MLKILTLILVASMSVAGCAVTGRTSSSAVEATSSLRSAEVGCATCIFDMKGVTGCKLAIKIDGKAYLVEGSDIDDHGDAHAADGLCNAVRKARVRGYVAGDKFVASKIEVLP